MAKRAPKQSSTKTVESLKHDADKRKNIPTAEYQSVIQKEEEKPKTIKYLRNTDLDPQLVWRGKDEQDWSDLVVHAPPLYIQEKVHPKVLIDDLLRQTREQRDQEAGAQTDLFADFNGMPAGVDKTDFYQHDQRHKGQQRRPHHPRARAGKSLPRHLARRHPQLSHLPPRSAHRRPRSA